MFDAAIETGLARNDHPWTAHRAATSAATRAKVPSLRSQVLSFLTQWGPHTDREIIDWVLRTRPGTRDGSIEPRRIELTLHECPAQVCDSGLTKLDPKSGEQQILWRATTDQEKAIELAGIESPALERQRRKVVACQNNLEKAQHIYNRMHERLVKCGKVAA